MRKAALSQMFLNNLGCFTKKQIEQICNTEPEGMTMSHVKAKHGKMLEVSDFQTSGIELFKTRKTYDE